MLDIGVSKLLLIGGIALVVIGPERLPRVARMAGTMFGRAQRYVADVKAEVNRSIELEELNRVKREFETAARDVGQAVDQGFRQATQAVDSAYAGLESPSPSASTDDAEVYRWEDPPPVYQRPNKKWRIKRGALPRWYKQREGLRQYVQSGAARVARHRPRSIVR
ncbi:MAG TPA: Sec-independent protein translocase protein TatB [Burkholderiaceae bacterium]|nr:Sec-independent protein translocase protein TatB [Burkholderiaceae bacterium]HMX12180.1 Sec-independent protein translocase protein TatB [Burkholderiaceae bacterium]HMZ01033.1 Sec-independent protein translocase protein TatB [Burkholderiaceae bacterium]HNB45483.1 Sec-independent protein translocase protein TatB [Burkholderiaceae bacterium]HNG80403.1 Sec-independent protein translocase protein TatB [Burkholderiaceae bacterium]